MKVILCGAGQVGMGIARHLAADGHDVTVIDSSQAILALQESLDVRTIVGAAADPEVLQNADAQNADMLIAVTRFDEMNMVICHIAQTLFDIAHTIARVRSQNYLLDPWRAKLEKSHILPRRTISPEREISKVVMSHLSMPGALEVFNFAHGKIKLVGIALGEECPALNTPLRQLTELFPNLRSVVSAVWREGELFIPHSDEQLLEGDEIYLLTDARDAPRAMSIFGREEKTAQRIIIVGGGQTGLHVAKQLEIWGRHTTKVKIIEKDLNIASHAVDELSHAIVIRGDGLDPAILREAGARDTETLICLTNSDQTNILTAMLAKQEGCKQTICLFNDPVYADIVRQVNIDAYLRLSSITISAILRNMRLGAITIYSIREDLAQCMEIEAQEGTDVVGASLRELKLPARVGAVRRRGEFIIPSGDLQIQIGDKIILFVLREYVKEIEAAFGIKGEAH